MLATIRDDTWNVLNMQHIKGPAHMVDGGHHPRNRPPTLGTTSVDFYHYPVTVWAYSTPQPNTEVLAPTGGLAILASTGDKLLRRQTLKFRIG